MATPTRCLEQPAPRPIVAPLLVANAKIPLPDRALLKPQDEPDCGLQVAQQTPNNDERAATSGMETGSISRGGPNTELAQRIALEYERECYRMAEARVRARLKQLQFSMARMAKAVRSAEQGAR